MVNLYGQLYRPDGKFGQIEQNFQNAFIMKEDRCKTTLKEDSIKRTLEEDNLFLAS